MNRFFVVVGCFMFVYRDFERRKRRTEQYSTNSRSGPPFVHDLSLMIGLPHSPLVHTADLDGGESGVDARHSCCSSAYTGGGGAVLLKATSISPF